MPRSSEGMVGRAGADFDVGDYRLPTEAHGPVGSTDIEVFNTPGFFSKLRERVTEKMDRQATEAGYPTA
jgi:hypothetical protein